MSNFVLIDKSACTEHSLEQDFRQLGHHLEIVTTIDETLQNKIRDVAADFVLINVQSLVQNDWSVLFDLKKVNTELSLFAIREPDQALDDKSYTDKIDGCITTFYSNATSSLSNEIQLLIKLKDLKSQLNHLESYNSELLSSATDGMIVVDANGLIEYANEIVCADLGYEIDELISTPLHSHFKHKQALIEASANEIWRNSNIYLNGIQARNVHGEESVLIHKDGHGLNIEYACYAIFNQKKYQGSILRYQDITEGKRTEKKLVQLAKYDMLTGLANRYQFYEYFQGAIGRAHHNNRYVGLLFIDLDRFRQINDNWGHDAGDILLNEVGKRLKSVIRQGDLVARLGGDEFAVLLTDVDKAESLSRVASKILAIGREPYQIEEEELFATFSIGISVFPDGGDDPDTLEKAAGTAMCQVKAEGRNSFKYFEPEMQKRVEERNRVEAGLHHAIKNDEFCLFYQPQIDSSSGLIVGMEALLRWDHPQWKTVSPAVFIPVAEECGLIWQIGEWVLKEGCSQDVAWQQSIKSPLRPLRVAINVSPRQLLNPDFSTSLKRLLDSTGLNPDHLEIEMTESTIMDNPDQAIGMLKTIADLGVHIAIDDFGTGYSCLSYLKKLPLDTLKIDRSFILDINHDKKGESIIKTIITLAHNLNFTVIAEGVETPEHVDFLCNEGCDILQGFGLSRPLDKHNATQLLQRNANEMCFELMVQIASNQSKMNLQQ